MAKQKISNLQGTMLSEFEIGKGSNFKLKRQGTQLLLSDEEVGEHPLSEFLDPHLAYLDVACLSTDVVGSFVCVRGDRIGLRYRVQTADCTDISKMPVIGLLVSKATPTVGRIQTRGPTSLFTGLTPGGIYVLNTTGITAAIPGAPIGQTVVRQILGNALASDVLYLNPSLAITVHRGQL